MGCHKKTQLQLTFWLVLASIFSPKFAQCFSISSTPLSSPCKFGRKFNSRRNRLSGLGMVTRNGGPNRDRPTEFFKDFEVLEQEIQCYLKDRENQEIEELKKTNNPLLSFFSLDEETLKSKKQRRIENKQLDILSYAELLKYGYKYLIDPISNQGGYIVVSQKMGIPVQFEEPIDDGPKIVDIEEIMNERKEASRGGLSLGSSLEDKLEQINDIDWQKRQKEKQNDILAGQRKMIVEDELYERESSPQYLKAEDTPGQVEFIYPPQPFQLNALQRLYTLIFTFSAAFGNGKATAQVLEMFDIPTSVVETFQTVGFTLLLMNVLSCFASSYVASTKKRSIPLWFFKGAVSGIPALLEIRDAESWAELKDIEEE
mmetsp:Transcript_6560/g.8880  ORF Transcript_6560/g.8880 Transcript_6560/m.8880 type:complete len:372 (+) Transcript_6560:65-1180(+)